MVTLLNTIEDPAARQVCRDHQDRPDALLEIFHDVQSKAGFVSDAALRTIANAVNLSRAEVHGVISFYHDYKRKPSAKTLIKICRAEACQAMGVNDLIKDAEIALGVKLDGGGTDVALQAVYCLGNCALSPAAMVNDKLYGRVDLKKLQSLAEAEH